MKKEEETNTARICSSSEESIITIKNRKENNGEERERDAETTYHQEGIPAAHISSLPQEILQEILVRLPLHPLRQSRLVSIAFLRATSGPCFLRRHRSLHPSLIGFFFNTTPHNRPSFAPTARSPDLRALIQRLDFSLPNRSLSAAGCSDGDLLCSDDARECHFVTNPLTKKWAAIPSHGKPRRPEEIGFISDPPHFKIIVVCSNSADIDDDDTLLTDEPVVTEVLVFSSATGEWRTLVSTKTISRKTRCYYQPSVVADGGFHWLSRESHILCFNEERSNLSFLDLPRSWDRRLHNAALGTAEDGRLCYACIDGSCIYVWALVNRFRVKWSLQLQIPLRGLISSLAPRITRLESSTTDWIRTIAFRGGDAQMVMLGFRSKVFSLCLRSGELREMYDFGDTNSECYLVFPYETRELSV